MGRLGYYRAALSAAKAGDLSTATRLAFCSITFNEDAPAGELIDLIRQHQLIPEEDLKTISELVSQKQYKKALKVKLPENATAKAIRGLLFALMDCHRNAIEEFSAALVYDTGNDLAKRAIAVCKLQKKGSLYELLRTAWG